MNMIYTAYYTPKKIDAYQIIYLTIFGLKKSIVDISKELFLTRKPQSIILMTRLEFVDDIEIMNNDGNKLIKITIEFK